MDLDVTIFRFLNDLAGQNVWTDNFFVFLAEYLIYCAALSLIILFLMWRKEWPAKIKTALWLCLFSILAYGVVIGFHFIWPRPRPFEGLLNVNQLIPENGFSFPSKHALFSFLMAGFVCGFNKRIGFWFLVAAILISLGRVLVGVHYPLDILVGAVLGSIIGGMVVLLTRRIRS